MFKKTLLIFGILSILITPISTSARDLQSILWNDSKGIKRLDRSRFKDDFYQLANFYQPQENPLFCGIATATMFLNAFKYNDIDSQKTGEILKPYNAGGEIIKYNLYSQKDFFNQRTDAIKDRDIISYKKPKITDNKTSYDAGVSLADLSKMLKKGHKLKTKLFYVKNRKPESIARFREILEEVFTDNKSFIAANFNGKILGQKTGGHISPLVAYDYKSDSVLILDVALHKGQWYWAPVTKLYEAMNSKDGKKYRGYLIVTDEFPSRKDRYRN